MPRGIKYYENAHEPIEPMARLLDAFIAEALDEGLWIPRTQEARSLAEDFELFKDGVKDYLDRQIDKCGDPREGWGIKKWNIENFENTELYQMTLSEASFRQSFPTPEARSEFVDNLSSYLDAYTKGQEKTSKFIRKTLAKSRWRDDDPPKGNSR